MDPAPFSSGSVGSRRSSAVLLEKQVGFLVTPVILQPKKVG